MKKQYGICCALLSIMVIAGIIGCGRSGKIPITTSSEQAMEDYLQGRALFEKLRLQESIAYFERAVKTDSTFAMAYLNLAIVSPSAKGFFENLEKAIGLTDGVSKGEQLMILGLEAAANGLPMKQREYYQKLVTLYPNDERAHNLLATNYFGLQDYALAVEEYKKAIAINPDFSQPYNQLGYAYRFLEHYTDAEEAFKKYIELIPDDPNPYDSYAELLLKMGKYDQSIENYQKALTIDPNFVPSHIGIATNLNFQGNHKAARQQLQKLLELARNDGERRTAYLGMAISYVNEGKMVEALDEIANQFQLAEKIGDAAAKAGDLALMGNILLEMGKLDKAMINFENSLKMIVDSGLSDGVKYNVERNFLYNSGRVALKKNDLESARNKAETFKQMAEVINNPFQIMLAHELQGMIALAEKNYDRAFEELEQANLQNPYNLYRMARAYSGKKDEEKAREFLMKVARFNGLNSLNYAFVRNRAIKELE